MSDVTPIPQGYHSLTPSLTIRGAAKALEFYQKAFNATEEMRLASPDGTVMHAEIKIGNSIVMISDEFPSWNCLSPQTIGGTGSSLLIYTENCDALFEQAIAAGATVLQPVMPQFWGDRMGTLIDPFGHRWSLATHVEDVPPGELEKRAGLFTGCSEQ